MPNVWNLGNTTLRNPNRIEQGLDLFAKEFQGNIRGEEQETLFAKRLNEEGIVSSGGTYSAFLARKWRNAFVKLGFATENKKIVKDTLANEKPDLKLRGLEYEITPAGKRLINASSIGAIHDVYLRQLVQHEIPSPIEKGFPKGQLKPFILLTEVLYKLHKYNKRGLNKTETAAYIQLFQDHTTNLAEEIYQKIISYRQNRKRKSSRVDKRKYDDEILSQAAKLGTVQASTLVDYADTTFRYSTMTNVVTRSGNRLILREDRIDTIERILNAEPRFSAKDNPIKYLYEFYKGAWLPTDNIEFAKSEIERLRFAISEYEAEIPKELIDISTDDIREIQNIRYELVEIQKEEKEKRFAKSQAENNTIEEILTLIRDINDNSGSIPDRPTFFEWAVWRAILAMNHIAIPIKETRRFPIDIDMLPRHPAPGGGPDMIFEFEKFIMAVEVTLTSSSRQIAAEGEPVRRHVADIKKDTDKPVYGLFIAPEVDNNTAETFRIGVWYWDDDEDFLNIVPMNLSVFENVIQVLLNRKYQPDDFRHLLDRCLVYRNIRAPEWKTMINREAHNWIRQIQYYPVSPE